jgi:hypothetical protein
VGEEGVRKRDPDRPRAEPDPPVEADRSAFVAKYRDAIDDRRQERAATPIEPVEALFSPLQVVVATLMFSTLGGSALVASNCLRRRRPVFAGVIALIGFGLAPIAPYYLGVEATRLDLVVLGAFAAWVFPALVAGFFVHVNQAPMSVTGNQERERSWGWALGLPILWSFSALILFTIGYFLLRTPPSRGAW